MSEKHMKLGIVLLAAGRSRRFGENKPACCRPHCRQSAENPDALPHEADILRQDLPDKPACCRPHHRQSAENPDALPHEADILRHDLPNKLLADFDGRPMVCCALDAAKAVCAARIAVVTGNETIAQMAGEYGYDVIANHAPDLGQSHSICLGVSAMQDLDAALLMVCDQPLLTGESLKRLIESFVSGGKGIACLRDQSHMGNPAVFQAKYFPELLALEGDRGAKGILRAHEDDLIVVDAIRKNELSDADTPQMLESIRSE